MFGLLISALVLAFYINWCRTSFFLKSSDVLKASPFLVFSKLALASFCAVTVMAVSLNLFYFNTPDPQQVQRMTTHHTDKMMSRDEMTEIEEAPDTNLDLTVLGPDDIKTRFSDVAGLEESKAEIMEVVDFLKNPKKYKALGASIPKGLLLYGPPGTGKTLIARAVAGEAGVSFIAVDGAAFDEMYVGVGAMRVRELFEKARSMQPCIIFIDEVDALAPSRSEEGAVMSGRIQTVNQLLAELDNVKEDRNEGIIVMAATNRMESLDKTLLRPGRFDRHVHIRLPNYNERVEIFKVHLQKVPFAKSIKIESLAGTTYGFSGADIKNIINEAALHAVKAKKDKVDLADFGYAIDKINLGLEVKSAIVTEADKRLTAYHEAGHAIVGILSPNYTFKFNKVTIGVRNESLGVTHFESGVDDYTSSRAFLEDNIAMLLAGRVAEEMLVGKSNVTTGAAHDLLVATRIAQRMVLDWGLSDLNDHMSFSALNHYPSDPVNQEVQAILKRAKERATAILAANRPKLNALAEALVKKEILDRAEVMKILEIKETQKN